jgi:phospholipid/cholesterol/gamma-HCH transport system permease protein
MHPLLERPAAFVGSRLVSLFRHVGRMVLLGTDIVRAAPRLFHNPTLTLEQMVDVGIRSLPLVFVVSLFSGATTAWQAKYQLEGFVNSSMIGTAVAKSIVLELGPVLTAFIVAGRVGSAISAELATMRVTEQIDALVTMSVDPVRYLILPRITAAVVMVPMLVMLSFFFGVAGGYITAVYGGGIASAKFLEGIHWFFYVRDVAVGLFKAYLFGAITSYMACYFGYIAEGGAGGVGVASIRAFASSAVLILLADFVVAFVAFT